MFYPGSIILSDFYIIKGLSEMKMSDILQQCPLKDLCFNVQQGVLNALHYIVISKDMLSK